MCAHVYVHVVCMWLCVHVSMLGISIGYVSMCASMCVRVFVYVCVVCTCMCARCLWICVYVCYIHTYTCVGGGAPWWRDILPKKRYSENKFSNKLKYFTSFILPLWHLIFNISPRITTCWIWEDLFFYFFRRLLRSLTCLAPHLPFVTCLALEAFRPILSSLV